MPRTIAARLPGRTAIALAALWLCLPAARAHNPGSVEIAQCTEILKDDPEDLVTRRRRAELFIAFSDYEDALKDCAFLLERKPDEAWVYRLRGRAFAMGEMYDKAVADFDRAWKLGDRSQDLLLLRGTAHRDGGRLEEAAQDLTRALALEKKFAIYYTRAEIYVALGRFEEAIADFEAFLRVQPTSVLYEKLARTCLRAGKLEKALSYASKALEKTPQYPSNHLLRARVLLRLGRGEEAQRDLGNALARSDRKMSAEFGPSAYDLLIRARILDAMGRTADAVACLDRAAEMEPEMVALYDERAALHEKAGRPGKARQDRETAARLRKKLARERQGDSKG